MGYPTSRQSFMLTLYCERKPKECALLSQANTPNLGDLIEQRNGYLISLSDQNSTTISFIYEGRLQVPQVCGYYSNLTF